MTSEETRKVIQNIVEIIVEAGRDLKVVFVDENAQVLGGVNKRNSNSIEIHSFIQEQEPSVPEQGRTPEKDFETCEECVYSEYEPMEFPCRECVHNAREHFRRR